MCFNEKNLFFQLLFATKFKILGGFRQKRDFSQVGGEGSPRGEQKFLCISG